MKRCACVLLVAAIPLAACAPTSVNAPSLLPRANETLDFDEPEPDPAPPTAARPDPALDAAIAEAGKALAAATARFAGDAARADALIRTARGAAPGSDSWLDAQVALAMLDEDRAATLAILGDLDQRAADHGVTGAPPYPALDEARARAQAEAAAQTARIAALSARLPTD